MKAVILAGGFGSRISEETHLKPKPMIEIGGRPMLWHIMKLFSTHNITDFIICCGYKGFVIKEYFTNYALHNSDITIDIANETTTVHRQKGEPWTITLVDTGLDTQTGGRLKRVAEYLKGEENFCFTYGDGLSDVDISGLLKFHNQHQKLATVTAVYPPGRFGALSIENDRVTSFKEKPENTTSYINGGFFVLSNECLNLIKTDQTAWEGAPLTSLASEGQLMAYIHAGFWQPMDTLRDKNFLEALWQEGNPPWTR